jgi:hypothetical protein
MLSKEDFLRNVISGFPLLSTEILHEFGVYRYLLNGIKERNVDLHLFEHLHHCFYFLSLFSKVRRCLESFWEWGSRYIRCLCTRVS